MPELLLELFSEEIPARMQTRAAEDLKRLVVEKLGSEGLSFTRADSFVTPRRLALVVEGIPEEQKPEPKEKKGPRVDAPETALRGFYTSVVGPSVEFNSELFQVLRSKNEPVVITTPVSTVSLSVQSVGKAQHFIAEERRAPRSTATFLPTLVSEIVREFKWPKSMRWGSGKFTWVRPLTRILCIFDGFSVPVHLEFRNLAGVPALSLVPSLDAIVSEPHDVPYGDTTCGHRFLAPDSFTVRDFADYKAKLRSAHVVLDAAERRAMILRDAEKIASLDKLKIKPDQGLLDEVAGLVEWPVVLMGTIDPAFMELPPEVLTTSMRAHQKYFSVLTESGALAPHFIVVANMMTDDGGKAIIAGNERVLRARLSDAKFFWDLDRKTKLEDRVPALAQRIFHAKLGTMAEKVTRIQTLAADLAEYIPGCDRDRARAAALLCKADLSSGMVGEFPELQGIMGRYYALGEGEKPDVADAIRDHYSPLGPNDQCPSAPVSIAVALADKIDSLVGFFAIDEKPTGSKDPFALRRAALGIIRLIVENKVRVPLNEAVRAAIEPYRSSVKTQVDSVRVRQDLLAFFADRLKVALREKGVRHDLIDAVFSLGGEDDLVRLLARVEALGAFLKTDDGANLLVAYRRASNIVAIEEKKDKKTYDGAVNQGELTQPEEVTLAKALAETHDGIQMLLKREDFAGAMKAMALLRKPVDAFFDKVTVNAPEANLRANRLRLLSRIRATLGEVADFSKIEG